MDREDVQAPEQLPPGESRPRVSSAYPTERRLARRPGRDVVDHQLAVHAEGPVELAEEG